jgi:hypothetical protein
MRRISSFLRQHALPVRGTFLFDAVTPDLPTDLPRGQVIVRGVALFDGNFGPFNAIDVCDRWWDGATRGLVDGLFTLGQTAVSARSRSCFDHASLPRSFGIRPP